MAETPARGAGGRFIKGSGAIRKRLKKMERKLPLEVAAALYQEALVITANSMRRTPVDVTTKKGGGTLRDSHETSAPRWKGKNLFVDIQVGGPAAPYAVIVHERILAPSGRPVKHIVGEAKFLEKAVLEAEPTLRDKVAKRIKLNRLV